MKIDIHTHTRKCKTGDAPTREISAGDFCEKILSTDVRVIAITNHNVFDLTQYEEIVGILSGDAQVWPGIELDILEGGKRGHLLVIVSPKLAKSFSAVVDEITKGFSADNFTATIADVLASFDGLEPLYVAHYKQKFPNISDEALRILEEGTKNPSFVLKEVTNSISAGIYISHGYSSIYGSDVHDWGRYEELSLALPDLRLPVDSFEHFCLLLKKDQTAINTVLDRKTPEELVLSPFGDDAPVRIKIFNDINVIFGPKGTGKSCILDAIAKLYSARGVNASVYESASDRLDDIFDTKGKDLTINLAPHGINYCSDEIKAIREAAEVNIASIGKYVSYFKAKNTNKNARKIILKDIDPEDEGGVKADFFGFHDAKVKASDFLDFIKSSPSVKEALSDNEIAETINVVSRLLDRLQDKSRVSFSGWKEVFFLNSAIKIFRREVERKTGMPANPVATGFRDYALNRIKIEANAAGIIKNINILMQPEAEYIGSLGSTKGDLSIMTEFKFQNGFVSDSALASLSGTKKTLQKNFVKCIRSIQDNAYNDSLFEHVAALNEIESVEDIKTVYELLLFKKYFSLEGAPYQPSSGESSMVMLQKELGVDKEVYILDEPERSLGNEYISDIIVPLIRERARAGKKIFISTHDANIAVRTLPYSSIYRCHDKLGYKTYVGNPFSNDLINPDDGADKLDWKVVSMKTLEGGKEAFGERGKIYGNN